MVAIILLCGLIIYQVSTTSSRNLVENTLSEIAREVIENAASAIDMSRYEQFVQHPAVNDYYYELRDTLNDFRLKAGVTYLYTMTRTQVNDTYEYIYMVDGLPVGSENESWLGEPEEDIASFPKIVKAFDEGTTQFEMTYTEEWGGTLSAYMPLFGPSGENIGIIGADIDVTAAYEEMNASKRKLLVFIFGAAIIISVLIFAYIHYSLRPLKKLVRHVERMGTGDLTASISMRRMDEIGYLANTINTMQHSVRDMIRNILQTAESVSDQSADLNQSSQEVKQINTQIAATMEQLGLGADSQAATLGTLARDMNLLGVRIEEANRLGGEIADQSSDIHGLAVEGARLMDESLTQMRQINRTMKEAVDKVYQLDSQADEISSLVDVIRKISDQTNLLALNASIEAARAGEHGAGFQVVAGEIRKLSEQVAGAVRDITSIVDHIQQDTKAVVQSLNHGYGELRQGSEQIGATGKAFYTITAAISDVSDKISSITGTLQEINRRSSDTIAAIDQVAEVSATTAAGVEQTSASVEEASSSMEQVAKSAEHLAKLAEMLEDQVKKFKI